MWSTSVPEMSPLYQVLENYLYFYCYYLSTYFYWYCCPHTTTTCPPTQAEHPGCPGKEKQGRRVEWMDVGDEEVAECKALCSALTCLTVTGHSKLLYSY